MFNAQLKPIESSEERNAPRYRLLLQASAEADRGGLVDIVIHDLSATGFLIECTQPLGIRAEVTLELPGAGPVTGDVVWGSGNFFGGEFRSPLNRSALDAARSSSPVVWPEFTPTSAANRVVEAADPVAGEEQPSAERRVDDRLPVRTRVQIITGISLFLWLPLAFGIWSLLF